MSHRDGERDLALFDPEDQDSCRDSIPLSNEEAATLADVLGTSVMISKLTDLTDAATGLLSEQLAVPTDSPFLNAPLNQLTSRTRTHASIVAIVRSGTLIATPPGDEHLSPGDVIIAVGTGAGLDHAARIIAKGTG